MSSKVEHFPLMIVDAPATARTIPVTAPFDGAEIATIETGDERHVEAAMSTAYALYRDHDRWLPVHERIAIIERACGIMQEQHEHLSLEAAREGGKPLIDSRVEVTRAIDSLRLCAETLKVDHGNVIPMGMLPSSEHRLAFTQKEPIGVVVAVSAFNHPLNLIVHQAGAAVAAGCPIVVKPADDTPLSCLRFVQILRDAGLPPEWCQVLISDSIPVAEALVTDKRVGFFSFIGSSKVGWMLRSKLAPGARCALEHGGVAPLIMCDDADEALALPAILKGGFYHAGQVCVSVNRVFVPRAKARAFAEKLADGAKELKVGDPTSADTEVGPLIRNPEVDRVHTWVREAVDAGAELLCGGEPLSESLYACTVLLDPPQETKVSNLEVFGPVVCVYGYDDLDDAVAIANSLSVSFQGAVFTKDMDTALRVYKRLDASAVMVNDHTAFRIDGMPFAGLRESGFGIGGIPYTMHDMQVEKMLVVKSPEL